MNETANPGTHRCLLAKVHFSEMLSEDKDANGNPQVVGRWMAYLTAPSLSQVDDVIATLAPKLHEGGYRVAEVVDVPVGLRVWSTSVGVGRETTSLLICAGNEELAMAQLIEACASREELSTHVKHGAFVTREIDMNKEGIW